MSIEELKNQFLKGNIKKHGAILVYGKSESKPGDKIVELKEIKTLDKTTLGLFFSDNQTILIENPQKISIDNGIKINECTSIKWERDDIKEYSFNTSSRNNEAFVFFSF